jgi:hypothetical protein
MADVGLVIVAKPTPQNKYIVKLRPFVELAEYVIEQIHSLGVKAGTAVLLLIALIIVVTHEWNTWKAPQQAAPPTYIIVPQEHQQSTPSVKYL